MDDGPRGVEMDGTPNIPVLAVWLTFLYKDTYLEATRVQFRAGELAYIYMEGNVSKIVARLPGGVAIPFARSARRV
jgi:hypothetical protein